MVYQLKELKVIINSCSFPGYRFMGLFFHFHDRHKPGNQERPFFRYLKANNNARQTTQLDRCRFRWLYYCRETQIHKTSIILGFTFLAFNYNYICGKNWALLLPLLSYFLSREIGKPIIIKLKVNLKSSQLVDWCYHGAISAITF